MQFSLSVSPAGQSRCLYTEAIDLAALGSLTIARASHVEPIPDGRWNADMSPVGGPILGPFPKRWQALAAEVAWMETNVL
jgi:hypothetical protein